MKNILKSIALVAVAAFQMANVSAQTLVIGDIGIIGYHTDASDGFTFIALTDVPAGEVVRFTEDGWCAAGSAWYITPIEGTVIWTAPAGGLSCGTIVNIAESGTPDIFNITPGTGTAVIDPSGGTWNQSGGDQIIAYQGAGHRPAVPSFLTAVHGDFNAGDYNAGTTWNNGISCVNTSSSGVPTGLTNGVNCISLFPSPGPERDNARYNGTLTGTSSAIFALINNAAN